MSILDDANIGARPGTLAIEPDAPPLDVSGLHVPGADS